MSDNHAEGGFGLIEVLGFIFLSTVLAFIVLWVVSSNARGADSPISDFIADPNREMSVTLFTEAHPILLGEKVEKAIAVFRPKEGEDDRSMGMLCALGEDGVVSARGFYRGSEEKMHGGGMMTGFWLADIPERDDLERKAEEFCQSYL